jgi:hypothetical protein
MTNLINSFKKVSSGNQDLKKVLWIWGVFPAMFDILVIERFIFKVHFSVIEIVLSMLIASYFVWHLVAIRKNIPEYNLPRAERKRLKAERKKQRIAEKKKRSESGLKIIGSDLLQKLLLKKSWGKFSFTKVVVCLDLIIILTHVNNILSNL